MDIILLQTENIKLKNTIKDLEEKLIQSEKRN